MTCIPQYWSGQVRLHVDVSAPGTLHRRTESVTRRGDPPLQPGASAASRRLFLSLSGEKPDQDAGSVEDDHQQVNISTIALVTNLHYSAR